MIKIHSGKYKGQNINRVNIKTTKETASMVREAVFNSLYKIEGNVLDLFAGSGSYGITAYSLGAKNVYFVDNNIKATKTIINNLNKFEIINKNVYKTSYTSFLNKNSVLFDYVFIDPPYNFTLYEELLNDLINHLNSNSYIVVETKKNFKINNLNDNFKLLKQKNYGSKQIIILNFINS